MQQKQHEVQSLQEEVESAATARSASEHSLSEYTERSRNELAEQRDTVKRLQKQLADAHSKLSQVQSFRTQDEQQAAAQQDAASKKRQEVSELKAQLRKAQEEVASQADARTLLQQQLGERTILLGQKAHQVAHLTAQLNEAKNLSGSSPHGGESGCLSVHGARSITVFVLPRSAASSCCTIAQSCAPLRSPVHWCTVA